LNIAFITHFCPHYRVKTFETLAKYHYVNYYFFSKGDEWYWLSEHGLQAGDINHRYLPGFQIGNTRITPSLISVLLKGNFDVFIKCINGRFALPVTFLIAKAKRKPFILWTGVWMRLDTKFHRLLYPITKYIYRQSDAVVAYGKHVKNFLIEEGVPEDRIFGSVHAVDNHRYRQEVPEKMIANLKEILGITDYKKVILYLGRLEQSKGIDYLLEAFALLDEPETCLIIAGKGSEDKKLALLAERLNIRDKIRFPGYIEISETVVYYAAATVFVLPSITTKLFKEPWGLVVNEAFNQGCPVIATNSVGAAVGGLVKDGENGFIVPERDSTAIASALEKLLSDENLQRKMGENAQKEILAWSNENMVAGFRQAIKYVTQNR